MTASSDCLAPGFLPAPYWWDAAPRETADGPPVPGRADVAIVGSGVTGLSAALRLARSGARVVVLDKGEPGIGASSRATGVLARSLKHGFSNVRDTLGEAAALAMYGEMQAAYDFIIDLIRAEGIDCDLQQRGRFLAANTPRHFDDMQVDLETKARMLGDPFRMVPKSAQHEELGTDLYHGGAVLPDHYIAHPAKYHHGLLAGARAAGATVIGRCAVKDIARATGGYRIDTAGGRVRADHVVVATNGYGDRGVGWYRRRVVPIDAYMAASEPLEPSLMREIIPHGRIFNDYCIDTDYARPSPDGTRLLFGGLTGQSSGNLADVGRRLHAKITGIFPQLRTMRISHAWTGRCAGAFDLYPHIGRHDGVHFAMGYCFGSGLPLGTYWGAKIAGRIIGGPDEESAFERLPFDGRFFHWGPPWFMPLVMRWYKMRETAGY